MANPNDLVVTKTVDLGYATVGDTLNYTVVLQNNGLVSDFNIILTDLIPQGANFVNNSIQIDGSPTPGNPALGINLPTIPAGGSSTVKFSALVVNIPTNIPLNNYAQIDYQFIASGTTPTTASIDSNIAVTTLNTPLLRMTKTAPSLVSVGATLTYTINVSNIGTTTAKNLIIIDTIPDGTTFVPNSVTINGTPSPASPASPGITFGNLPNGFMFNFVFKVTVTSIPPSGNILNQGVATYNFDIDPNTGRSSSSSNISNQTISSFASANLSGITKSVNKNYATTGDILVYTITIPNTGSITAFNVVVHDTVPNGLTFISNSVYVNSIPTSFLPSSISVGTISAGSIATITFSALVD